MLKQKTYMLMALVMCLAGCRKDELVTGPSQRIAFAYLYGGDMRIETKAAEVTSLPSFQVSCTRGSAGSETAVWTNETFTGSGSSYTGSRMWPEGGNPGYHFYAANAPLAHSAAGATVTLSGVSRDIVCAYMPSPTYKKPNTLTFNHILTRLNDVTVTAETGYTLSSVSIALVPRVGGTYNLRTGQWSGTSLGNAVSLSGSSPGTTANDLWLLPGSYTLTCAWTASRGGGSSSFSGEVSNPFTLSAGKINSLHITLGATVIVETVPLACSDALTWIPDRVDIALPGVFSVSSGTTVRFARGNLQAVVGAEWPADAYNYTAKEWRVAEHQWEIIHAGPGNTNFAVNSVVDLFGWVGASAGFDTCGLTIYETPNSTYYGTVAGESLKTEWGAIPDIRSKYTRSWRTLTTGEWTYLLTGRPDALQKIGKARINHSGGYEVGIVILPDSWTLPSNCSFTGNAYPTLNVKYYESSTSGMGTNTYSATGAAGTPDAWVDMENAGALFLPCTAYRSGLNCGNEEYGYYHSSTSSTNRNSYGVQFYYRRLTFSDNATRTRGRAVRLVCQQ